MINEVSESDRLTRTEGQVTQLTVNVAQLSADVRLLLDRVGTYGKPNWPVIIAGIGIAITILATSISAFYFLTTLQTQSIVSALVSTRISPMESKAEISIRDRQEIRDQLGVLQGKVSDNTVFFRENIMKINESLREVETQFLASDQMRNIQLSSNMRWTAILWKKVYGDDFPTYEYYPSIAQPPK